MSPTPHKIIQPSAEQIDRHLDNVLTRAGSGLRHYTMHRSLELMRNAMREALIEAARAQAAGPELQQFDAALAGMTHHITDEQPAKAPATLADIQRKLASAQSCHPKAVQTLIAEALDLIDYVARAGIGAAPAPAVPSDPTQQVRPYEPTEPMRWAMKRIDPALTHDQCRALWSAAWTAAPTPPAQSEHAEPVVLPKLDDEPASVLEFFTKQLEVIGRGEWFAASSDITDDTPNYRRATVKDAMSMSRYWLPRLEAASNALTHFLCAYEGTAADIGARRKAEHAMAKISTQPAVPEDVAREPMTQKWCWWLGDAETFHFADTESEAHGEAQSRIDDDCEPGDTREYSVGRVQHPIDALGVDWLAEHVAETIEENTREWCDDNTGAEDQSITLAAEDRKLLGTMVATFLRERAAVHWWTADQKTITTHTYVAGSSDDADAARAAEKGGTA